MKRDLKREILPLLLFLLGCIGMLFLPEGPRILQQKGIREKALVLSVDNSQLQTLGALPYGTQSLQVKMLEGEGKGRTFQAGNELRGHMELDKLFTPGDRIVVARGEGSLQETSGLTAQDHDRSGFLYGLFGAFALFLILFGSWTGARALLSFVLGCLTVWKVIIPLVLRGASPLWTIFFAVVLLTFGIIFLVAGFNKKGLAASLGAVSGVLAGLLMAELFTALMKLNGAVLPFAQTLVNSGYESLPVRELFTGGLILCASGAVMDLAMDIASGTEELARHAPELTFRELFFSGIRMGRSVVGTMTTTLLLAYSGGFITLLMMFYAQGTPIEEFLNNPLVASEAVKTLVGSFALVLVAPFTAFIAAGIYGGKKREPAETCKEE